MDSDAPEKLEMAKVDFATEADKLLLQVYRFVDGNPGKRIIPKDFYNTINFDKETKAQQQTIKYLLGQYLFKYKNFLAPLDDRDKHLDTVFRITPAGFEHIHEMLTTRTESQKAFCAMWFDEKMKPIWEEAIKPAIEETRHEPVRIDEKEFNDDINAQMIMLIRKSKFLIADFTGDRGGVYFEAGFAKGLGLEVIYTCEEEAFKTTAPHFDINHYNFILWNREDLPSFKKQLADRITITIPGE